MQVWISGGGTGGHVYPALAVVEALMADRGSQIADRSSQIANGLSPIANGPMQAATDDTPYAISDTRYAICYIGSLGGMEQELVKREAPGVAFEAIPAGGLHGLAPWTMVRNAGRLAHGVIRSMRLVARQQPQVLFVTGGFVTVPVALACWAYRVPILLYLPDIEPGWAERFLSRLAARIGVTAEASQAFFPGRPVTVTGYPVRRELVQARTMRAEARAHFGLEADRKAVLVFGGSKGARSLNQALGRWLEQMLARWQVIHISGTLDADEAQARRDRLDAELQARYKLFAYLHSQEMALALAAADLAISRSGASILGELPLMGLPAILVPYPFAWRYQKVNADYLVERGAAVRLDNDRLDQELWTTCHDLIDDEAHLATMRQRAGELARPDAALVLASHLQAMASRPTRSLGGRRAGRQAA